MSVVVLLSRQRSGTGAFASVLERHPDIYYCGEILDHTSDKNSFFNWLASHDHRVNSPLEYPALFEEFIQSLLRDDRINLIDIKYNSLNVIPAQFRSFQELPWTLDYLSRIPVPMINLRRSLLQTYISAKLAERSGTYHLTQDHAVETRKIALDVHDLTAFHHFAAREDAAIANFFCDYGFSTVIEYDDCFTADGTMSEGSLQRIGHLLDLDFSSIHRTPNFKKQSARNIADKVDNLPEVLEAISRIAA